MAKSLLDFDITYHNNQDKICILLGKYRFIQSKHVHRDVLISFGANTRTNYNLFSKIKGFFRSRVFHQFNVEKVGCGGQRALLYHR